MSVLPLSVLLRGVTGVRVVGDGEVRVRSLTMDSRTVTEGALFAALAGTREDGARFIGDAVAKKAAVVLCAHLPQEPAPEVTYVVADDPARALGRICAAWYENPSHDMDLVAVTGTNGKTTTTFFVESLCKRLGHTCGVIGTTGYRWQGTVKTASHTTPDALTLQGLLADMRASGVDTVAVEFSSHAIVQHRVEGCTVSCAVFTGLSQDHLDYHRTMDEYFAAKALLFTHVLPQNPAGVAVIDADCPYGRRLMRLCAAKNVPVRDISLDPGSEASFTVLEHACAMEGSRATVRCPDGITRTLNINMPGVFNIRNALYAAAAGAALKWDLDTVFLALSAPVAVPGRLEKVGQGTNPVVFVDYAHTPDALVKVLTTLRPLCRGRLICVMGCGGDRDRGKRPLMGEAAARYSDVVVVTSDNPRSEDPRAIIDMIVPGVTSTGMPALFDGADSGYLVLPDRALAIGRAIAVARDEDVVCIAGKGHENYQVIGTVTHHFDDREQAALALKVRA